MKKIYPIDWREIHPDKMTTATDQYYVGLANKVLDVLKKSLIVEIAHYDDNIRDAAVRLTAWFEDICSELGIWRVVGETCLQRYGKPLPFYDTKDYYAGEPNPQDVRLLLWDIIQSWHSDRVINPENPVIEQTANEIYKILDAEYDYAPETDEMVDYLSNSQLGRNYLVTRRAIEWFTFNGYLSLRGVNELAKILDEQDITEYHKEIIYALTLTHTLTDRHNLLALSSPEWLALAIGKPFSVDVSHLSNRYYTIEECLPSSLQLQDMVNGDRFMVEADSFDEKWLKQYGHQKGLAIYCGLVGFNGAYYQCGALISNIDKKDEEKKLEEIRQQDHIKKLYKESEELFYEASKGKSVVFLKGIKALEQFYKSDMGIELIVEHRRQIEEMIEDQAEDGMVALMTAPNQGILTITLSIPALKSPDNPFYDPDYARLHAHELLITSESIEYSAACRLLREGYLSDAALKSSQGYDHGHQLLQDNAQFLLDYIFAEHQ